jgi:Rrf2 family protein
MRFSTRAEYGLRAAVNLARAYPQQKNLITISKEENISEKYLERLVGELRKNNILHSSRGKSGGYTLSKKPSLIRVGEIIEILEGTILPMKCADKKNVLHCKCSSREVWIKLGEQIRKTLHGIKLSELLDN